MTKKLFLVLATLFVMAFSANAKGILFYSTGDHVVKVLDLPKDNDLFALEGDDGEIVHLDLGIMHSQFSLMWIPVFNYGEEKYVLYKESRNTINYVDLDEAELKVLHALYDFPETPSMPFWHKIGGKLVWILIIGAIIFIKARGKDDEEEVAAEEANSESEEPKQ